jgi:hypothetical protein
MNKRKLPQFYRKSEIKEIIRRRLEVVRDDIAVLLSNFIEKQGFLDINLFNNIRVPMFVMRIETFHSILDEFKEYINNPQVYNQILRNAGEQVGISFAIDILKFYFKVG